MKGSLSSDKNVDNLEKSQKEKLFVNCYLLGIEESNEVINWIKIMKNK